MAVVEQIWDDVAALAKDEKLYLVDKILGSLHAIDSEIEAWWIEEAQRRIKSYEQGQSDTIEASEVFAAYRR